MSRKEDFIQAGIDYRFEQGKPMAISGDNFADVANEMNRTKPFEDGAEYGYQYAVTEFVEKINKASHNSFNNGWKAAVKKVCDIMNHYCNRSGVHPSRRVDIINHILKETASVCENMTKIQKELQKKGGQDGK